MTNRNGKSYVTSFASSLENCKKALDKTPPKKKKYARAKDGSFMNKEIRKAIMKRTRLRNKYFKSQCVTTNSQRNLCVSIVRKAKWDYYNKLDHKELADNKNFWKTVKPFFTDKGVNNEKMLLFEEVWTISGNKWKN